MKFNREVTLAGVIELRQQHSMAEEEHAGGLFPRNCHFSI